MKVCDTALTKQSGPLSHTAHVLMIKPLMKGTSAKGSPAGAAMVATHTRTRTRTHTHTHTHTHTLWGETDYVPMKIPMLAFRLHYWLARGVGNKQADRPAVSRPALRCHVAAAAKLRVALCRHSLAPQEAAALWSSDSSHPTVHNVRSVIKKLPEII